MNFLNVATALLQKYGIPYNLGSTASQARIKAEEHIAGVYLPCSLRRQLYSVLTLAQQEETTDDILVANPAADAALQRFRERANMMAPDPATNAALQRFRQRAMQRAVQGGALSAASSAGNV